MNPPCSSGCERPAGAITIALHVFRRACLLNAARRPANVRHIRAKHGHDGDGAELGRRGPALGMVPRFFARPLTPILAAAAVATLSRGRRLLQLPRQWLALWSVVLGLSTGSYPTVLTLVKASMPKGVIVHAVALVSMGSMIGVFIGQMAFQD